MSVETCGVDDRPPSGLRRPLAWRARSTRLNTMAEACARSVVAEPPRRCERQRAEQTTFDFHRRSLGSWVRICRSMRHHKPSYRRRIPAYDWAGDRGLL